MTAATIERPKASRQAPRTPQASTLSTTSPPEPTALLRIIDRMERQLEKASTALFVLTHLFGGDSGVSDPAGSPGLPGTLHHVARLLIETEADLTLSTFPDDVRQTIAEARSLVDLIAHMENEGEYEWQFASQVYAAYFWLARDATELACSTLRAWWEANR